MKGYNKVTLLGGLTRDPEVQYGRNGGSAYRTWLDRNDEMSSEISVV